VSPVKYELGFYIPEDGILHSHRHDNLKSYTSFDFYFSMYKSHSNGAVYTTSIYKRFVVSVTVRSWLCPFQGTLQCGAWRSLRTTNVGAKVKSKLSYGRRSVGQSVLVSGHHVGPTTNFSFPSMEEDGTVIYSC
jgi:hypothetical protein